MAVWGNSVNNGLLVYAHFLLLPSSCWFCQKRYLEERYSSFGRKEVFDFTEVVWCCHWTYQSSLHVLCAYGCTSTPACDLVVDWNVKAYSVVRLYFNLKYYGYCQHSVTRLVIMEYHWWYLLFVNSDFVFCITSSVTALVTMTHQKYCFAKLDC